MVHFPSFSIEKWCIFHHFPLSRLITGGCDVKKRYSFSGSHELNLQAMHLQRETSLALQEKAIPGTEYAYIIHMGMAQN
jgi:hypothetical protein